MACGRHVLKHGQFRHAADHQADVTPRLALVQPVEVMAGRHARLAARAAVEVNLEGELLPGPQAAGRASGRNSTGLEAARERPSWNCANRSTALKSPCSLQQRANETGIGLEGPEGRSGSNNSSEPADRSKVMRTRLHRRPRSGRRTDAQHGSNGALRSPPIGTGAGPVLPTSSPKAAAVPARRGEARQRRIPSESHQREVRRFRFPTGTCAKPKGAPCNNQRARACRSSTIALRRRTIFTKRAT